MVDNHQSLCKRGIVQLFNYPHPPKNYQTAWTSKTPPRIYSQSEIRRRMTRSTEDLSNKYRVDIINEMSDSNAIQELNPETSSRSARSSSKNRTHSPNVQDDSISSIERSPSLHSNVQRTQNQIFLPKDYNPIAAIAAVENMEVFLSKTFYKNVNHDNNFPHKNIDYPASNTASDEGVNAFTNKIFTDGFEENLMKDTKRLHNLNHKNLFVQNSTRNFRQIISDHRHRELQVLACIIVEIFLANKLRPLIGISSTQNLDDRIEACRNVLKADFDLLPKCVQYPVKLLFSSVDPSSDVITEFGLPKPSANQLLQPFLSNFLFPFPYEYLNVYTLLKSLHHYDTTNKLLDLHTYFECDGTNCRKFDSLDKQRTLFKRKIAECKVMACAAQIDRLMNAHGYEQFNSIDLILPQIIDLLTTEGTSILAAWFLFDSIAAALGSTETRKQLLEPILKLYDAESIERVALLNSSIDSSMKFTTGAAFKSRKTIKLYHHSFLLRLIVRFGLRCFLNNFVPPLIEAIGGYKEPIHHSYYHYHDNSKPNPSTKLSNKNLKMCNDVENTDSSKKNSEDEMFSFDNDCDDMQKPIAHINLTDSSDNDADGISRILDHFDLNSTAEGKF